MSIAYFEIQSVSGPTIQNYKIDVQLWKKTPQTLMMVMKKPLPQCKGKYKYKIVGGNYEFQFHVKLLDIKDRVLGTAKVECLEGKFPINFPNICQINCSISIENANSDDINKLSPGQYGRCIFNKHLTIIDENSIEDAIQTTTKSATKYATKYSKSIDVINMSTAFSQGGQYKKKCTVSTVIFFKKKGTFVESTANFRNSVLPENFPPGGMNQLNQMNTGINNDPNVNSNLDFAY